LLEVKINVAEGNAVRGKQLKAIGDQQLKRI